VAYLIDGAILSVAYMAIWVPLLIVWFAATSPQTESDPGPVMTGLVGFWLFSFMLIFGIYYVYLVEMMFRSGQTVGKRIMKLRIVPVDPAATLTRGVAARRYLVQIVGGVVGSCVFFGYLDGLWQLWDKPHRQCLHDKYARTVVVKVAP
jgi:uncharacterized RDD family membrane protein YckC